MTALVSIIMPVYNGEPFLADAIQSVVEQTYPEWELIVVDDGSTDATAQIVAAVDDARITYIRQPNQGQAAALNRGLDRARGAFVTTLDADDRMPPSSLLDRVRWLEAHPEYGAVYADGYFCSPTLEPQLRFSQHRAANVVGDIYADLINTPLFGTGACVLIRTEVLHQWHIRYDESIVMCQDWDFYIRLSAHVPFGYVDTISVYYRVHPANMTQTVGRERHITSIIRTRAKVLESSRFGALDSGIKREFLRRMLVNTLRDRRAEQEALLDSPSVRALLPADRARLLRWLATEWLLTDVSARRAHELLCAAQALAPGDAKTAGMAFLVRTNPGLARRVLWAWHHMRPRTFLAQMRLAAELSGKKPQVASPWR